MIRLLFSLVELPIAIIGSVAAVAAICGCMACFRFRCRNLRCVKTLLRWIGVDEFDDFEMMVLVHEVMYQAQSKQTVAVQVTAGQQTQKTDFNSRGMFQQPLHIFVEQGTDQIRIDILNDSHRVMSSIILNVQKDILDQANNLGAEVIYAMKQKQRGFLDPKIKLTLVVGKAGDMEQGLLAGVNSDVEWMVCQQLRKVRNEGAKDGKKISDIEVLRQACCGLLDLFEGLGVSHEVYCAVVGPPHSRRWTLGLWSSKADHDHKQRPFKEVDMMRIQSVPGDPDRIHVFVVNYFDEDRSLQRLTFRANHSPRDVWVEMLLRLIQKLHDARDEKKARKEKKYHK